MRNPVNGLKIAIAATYAAAATFTSASNASECVLSFATNPTLVAGDILEVTSGWQRLDGRVVRVKTVSGAGPYLVTLESINTTSTTLYPAGEGAGTVRKVSTWQTIPQVVDISAEGGAQQFFNWQYADEDDERSIPTNRSARSVGLDVHNDETSAAYPIIETAQDAGALAALRMTSRSGRVRYANAYWSIAEFPGFPKNQVETRRIDLAIQGRTTYYAS